MWVFMFYFIGHLVTQDTPWYSTDSCHSAIWWSPLCLDHEVTFMLKSMGLNKEGLNLVCWFVCLCTLLSSQFLAVIIPVVSNEEAMALKIHYPARQIKHYCMHMEKQFCLKMLTYLAYCTCSQNTGMVRNENVCVHRLKYQWSLSKLSIWLTVMSILSWFCNGWFRVSSTALKHVLITNCRLYKNCFNTQVLNPASGSPMKWQCSMCYCFKHTWMKSV